MKEYLLENGFTTETLLDELVQAMSDADGVENFEFIARMNDITLPEGD